MVLAGVFISWPCFASCSTCLTCPGCSGPCPPAAASIRPPITLTAAPTRAQGLHKVSNPGLRKHICSTSSSPVCRALLRPWSRLSNSSGAWFKRPGEFRASLETASTQQAQHGALATCSSCASVQQAPCTPGRPWVHGEDWLRPQALGCSRNMHGGRHPLHTGLPYADEYPT